MVFKPSKFHTTRERLSPRVKVHGLKREQGLETAVNSKFHSNMFLAVFLATLKLKIMDEVLLIDYRNIFSEKPF